MPYPVTISARYENGAFRPVEAVPLKEGAVVEVHVLGDTELARKRKSIKDLPFYGMWADRDDIGDGVSYVSALRNHSRGQ